MFPNSNIVQYPVVAAVDRASAEDWESCRDVWININGSEAGNERPIVASFRRDGVR